ncbi:MAG TPA: HipA N-terminal domain-containing protein [Streptosporangiaceae bacterium]|nr:HipA N-terminal domain-containing protein [Streptosporangiaceae bacterium]
MSSFIEARVKLHGRNVGSLLYEKGGSSFVYEDDLTSPDHQTLGQIFEDDPRKPRQVKVGLPPWFENLLPEGEMRKQIVREMGGVSDSRDLCDSAVADWGAGQTGARCGCQRTEQTLGWSHGDRGQQR